LASPPVLVARAQGEPFVVGERSLSIQHQTDRGDRDPALGPDQPIWRAVSAEDGFPEARRTTF